MGVCFNDLSGGLKISFQVSNWTKILIFCAICLGLAGCAKRVSAPSPGPSHERPIETGVPGKDLDDLSPRAQASLRLTEQGRLLLESGRPNNAICILEQAINLNPANGLNYYYLSEAWLFKGKFEQAAEFNALAELYLEDSRQWRLRVNEQKERIRKLME